MAQLTTELPIDANDSPIQSVLPVASSTGKTLTTGATTAQVALPAGAVITFKAITTACHVKLGTGTPTAATTDGAWDFYLGVDQERTVPVGTATNVAAIATGAGALKMWSNG
jgi:hypothetical protein